MREKTRPFAGSKFIAPDEGRAGHRSLAANSQHKGHIMPSPFETHPTWQSENPGLARRDRENHHRRITETGPAIEDLPSIKDVGDYFRSTERGDLLRSDPSRSRYAREKTLLHDLEVAEFGDDPDEKADELRGLIWAYSKNREYPEQSLKRAVKAAEEIAAELREEPVEKRGESPEDVRRNEQARDARADRIEEIGKAIEMGVNGGALRDLLPAIEVEYSSALNQAGYARGKAKKRAESRLSGLRILRDAVYQSHLFPVRSEMKHRTEFPNQKTKRRVA